MDNLWTWGDRMADERGTRREVVSPYLLRPRRSIEEVMVQRRRPAAVAVDMTDDATPETLSGYAKRPNAQD